MFQFHTFYTKHLIWKAILVLLVVIVAGQQLNVMAVGPNLKDVNVEELVNMVEQGDGQTAVAQISEVAYALGHFAPAPNDTVVFDSFMSRQIRGAVIDFDELPSACTGSKNAKVGIDRETCANEFWAQEPTVRFGRSFFTTPQEDGSFAIRSADDILATFIEETGHSWQEYLYETNGRGGQRIQVTTIVESERWAAGREYQVKRYILSLDGSLINLSDEQRTVLKSQICLGYASPIGAEVPAYGAPADWPNPEGWPTTNPTLDELTSFCGDMVVEPDF